MKIAKVGALAGTLFLFPHAGMADEPVWRSAAPEWKSSKATPWSPIAPTNPRLRNWAHGDPALWSAIVDPDRELLPMPVKVHEASATEPELLPQQPRKQLEPEPESPIAANEIVPVVLPVDREKILPPEVSPGASAKILPPELGMPVPASLGKPVVVPAPPSKNSGTACIPCDGPTFLMVVDGVTPRFSVSGEYLAWWMKSDRIPVLATTSTAGNVGIIGQNGTQNLLGPGPINDGERNGARFRANLWLNDARTWGIDAGVFFLGPQTFRFGVNSNTFPVISRPVFVLSENREDAESVAAPGLSTGTLRVDSTSRFWGTEANLMKRLCVNCDRSFDVFVGYRYLNLSEDIRIREFVTAGANAPDPAGTQVTVTDKFFTRNEFNGGQIGARYEQAFGRFFVNARGSIGLGDTYQFVDVDGSQVRVRPGQAAETFVGGLLAARSNIGHSSRDRFGFVPELGANIGYEITPRLRVFVGYNFLWWNSVLRPGEQIDRGVDLNNIPNARPSPAFAQPRPTVLYHESGLWVQGGNVGLQWSW